MTARIGTLVLLCSAFCGCSLIVDSRLQGSADAGSSRDQTGNPEVGPSCALAECEAEVGPCYEAYCDGDQCGRKPRPEGWALEDPLPGNCERPTCNGNGQEIVVYDPSDAEDDARECTDDVCEESTRKTIHKTRVGQPCSNGTCDQAGECVGGATCTDDSQCLPADPCKVGRCDLGGGHCIEENAEEGKNCDWCKTCKMGFCTALVCPGPCESCNDGKSCGPKCKACEDCKLGLCVDKCPSPLVCGDGGVCVDPPKGNGEACTQNGDCASRFCESGYCCATNNCLGTCVTCGPASSAGSGNCGPVTPGEDPHNSCMAGNGAEVCGSNKMCACSDGQPPPQPGKLETGKDCGGFCPKCTVGQTCVSNTDCQSGICLVIRAGLAVCK